MELIINKLKQQTIDTHGNDEYALKLADKMEVFIRAKLKEYSKAFGLSEKQIIEAIENKRDYCAVNYYQEANFPSLEDVKVFGTKEELYKSIPNKQFRCPSCNGISTNPYECNSGIEVEKNKVCVWKAYGLFRTIGKGLRFTIKDGFLDKPFVDEIFMPIDYEKDTG